jgi:hypothetical protein
LKANFHIALSPNGTNPVTKTAKKNDSTVRVALIVRRLLCEDCSGQPFAVHENTSIKTSIKRKKNARRSLIRLFRDSDRSIRYHKFYF